MKKIQKLFIMEMEIDDKCDEYGDYFEEEIDFDETDIWEMIEEYVEDRNWKNLVSNLFVKEAWVQDGKIYYLQSRLSEEAAK